MRLGWDARQPGDGKAAAVALKAPSLGVLRWFKLLDLTTRRRSGQPYTVRLWFHVHGGSLWIVSSMGLESYWARHILRDPRVEAVVGRGDVTYKIEGKAIIHGDRSLLRAMAAEVYRKYYGWLDVEAVRDWCRGATLVEVQPVRVERRRNGGRNGQARAGVTRRRNGRGRPGPNPAAKGI